MVAESVADGLSKADADILDGVVPVDAEVAINADFKIELAVARKESQKMIECPNSRFDRRKPGAVDREIETDRGLGRRAPDRRGAARHGRRYSGVQRAAGQYPRVYQR